MNKVNHIFSLLASRLTIIVTTLTLCFSCEKLEIPDDILNNSQTQKPDTPNAESNQDKPSSTQKDEQNNHGSENQEDDSEATLDKAWEYFEKYGTSVNFPYTISKINTYIQQVFDYAGYEGQTNVYVTGHIVGFVNGTNISKTVFSSAEAVETNIVLADAPEEKDVNNCIAVQLSNGSSNQSTTRFALNLANHPENLHTKVTLQGTLTKYMGKLGVKGAKNHKIVD